LRKNAQLDYCDGKYGKEREWNGSENNSCKVDDSLLSVIFTLKVGMQEYDIACNAIWCFRSLTVALVCAVTATKRPRDILVKIFTAKESEVSEIVDQIALSRKPSKQLELCSKIDHAFSKQLEFSDH
jgi:hypothetical protein